MKKNFTRITLTLMLGFFSLTAAAATGWYEDYVKINVNNAGLTGPTGYYWIGTNPSWATSFVNGLGTVSSLKLDGADMKYWSDTQDRTGGSFFYQVTSADGLTTYIAATEAIWTQSYLGGNNYQGMSSGLNVDLLAGIPAGTACKLTVWAKSWGTGQGDSWLTNSGANYTATFTTASILLTGATGINNTRYTTLKGAFDAINANTSGLNTDDIAIKVGESTTETAAASLNYYQGLYLSSMTAGTGYQAPTITLTGGTGTAGTLVTTIVNGAIKNIVMTGGSYSVKPTGVTISAPTSGTTATATVALDNGGGYNGNLIFTIGTAGTGYGPSATITNGGGTGAAVDVIITTAATAPGSAPATVGLSYALTNPGTGYTSNPTCSISSVAGGSGASFALAPCADIKYNTLVVYPTVAGKTISGSVGLVSIVGRQKVTIDGRVGATGTPTVGNANNLTFSSSSRYYSAFTLDGDAQNNTIKYCTIKGNTNNSASGIVLIGATASTTNGNGNNTIDHNLITNNGGQVLNGLYAIGNTSKPNLANQITNNEFKDILNANLLTNVLYIAGGATAGALPQNDNFTISGNSFYNVGLNCAAGNTRQFIAIGSGTNTYGGAHTITDNYIGSTAANCSGSNIVKYNQSSHLYCISVYASASTVGAGPTSIQNNTIQKITWGNGANANFVGIYLQGNGDVNIGTSTGNTIGDNTTTGSIVCSNYTTAGNTTGIIIANTGTVDCQKNKIGSIKAFNNTAAVAAPIIGIQKTATSGSVTISNNVIGSTTISNSIYAYNTSTPAVAAVGQNINGISCQGTGTNNISNNTIANLTNFTTIGYIYGINMNGTGSTGILVGNLIHSNIITGYTGTGALIGIACNAGTNTLKNNIIKLGDNNVCEIRGIADGSTATSTSSYHNTIYIGGSPTTGAFLSYCEFSSGPATIKYYKNNIYVNARSNNGATGTHYAIYLNTTNTGTLGIDGNNYYVSGTGGVLCRYSTDKPTLLDFKNATGQDASSVNVDPSFANVAGTTAVDFKANNSALKGVTGTGVTTDYAGTTRTVPVMGAYESPVPVITGTAITMAFTTTYGTVSSAQTFSVSGTGLYANITATAPTGFEVSSDASTYGATATFTQTNGSASGTLSIRLKADAAIGSYNSQSIVLLSTGATSVNITTPASGNAVNAIIPTVTPTIGTYTYDGNPQGPTAATNSGSGTSYTFSYAGTGNTSYSASATRPTAAGTYTVTVTVAADGNYAQASSAATAFTILSPSTVSSDTNVSALTLSSGTNLTVASGSTLTIDENTTVNSVTVAAGGKLTVNNSSMLNAAGGITLQNTASGTASFVDSRTADNPTAIAGTVEQAITGTDRNWYVAVPVTGRTASDITLSGASIVKRNEATVSWEPVSAGTALTAGVGYIAVASASGGNATWTLAGNLQSGKVEVNVTRSGASSAGFNLLGNPYPSYLNWEQVLNLNATNASTLQPTIWYRTATYNEGLSKYDYTFNTYNSVARIATPTSTTGYIPPMQAFWVRANSAGTVTFTNAMRSHGDGASNKLKAPAVNTQKIVRLQVANTASISDETVLHFDVNAQNSFDNYDSPKMFNNVASKPEIFTSASNEKLVINGMNDIPYNTEIPLGFVTGQTGDFSISRTEFSNFNAGTRIMLKDALNPATEFELAEGVSYNFSAQPTTATTNRFSLVFRAPGVATGIDKTSKLNTQVFVNAANQIVIIAPVKSNYAIYNAMGQLMENGVLNTERETRNTKLTTGVYIVKVGNTNSTRVIIK